MTGFGSRAVSADDRAMRRPPVVPFVLGAVVVLAVAFGAVDSVLARRALPHRPVEARLFLEAVALWLAYGVAALVPAWVTLRVLARLRKEKEKGEAASPGRTVGAVVFWTAFPVVGHTALDRFTGEGQNVSGLSSPLPWLVLLLTIAAVVAAAWGVAWLLGRVRARLAGGVALLVALPVGFLFPLSVGASPGARSAAGDKPNLLLIVWDTCRADHVEPYGYERNTTPRLAEFAADALVYEDARSASVFTFTSHLSMLTGVMPSTHGARLLRTQYDPRRARTLPEVLREAGYRTGAFVGTDVLAGRTGIRHGFDVYDDRVDPRVCDTHAWKLLHDVQAVLALAIPALRNNGRPHWIQDFQRPADGVLANALEWIREDDGRPWFCMVNLYDVHWPYLPGEEARDALVREYNGALNGFLFRADGYDKSYEPTAEDARHVADLYDAEIFELDGAVDGFLDQLDLDDTAVLITSDHGEAFGEAGHWKHEHVFEPQLRIPFLLRLPGGERAGRVPGPVSGIDVAPTLLGLAGVAAPEEVEGLDLLATPPAAERLIQVEDRDHLDPTDVRLAIYRGPWKLVRRGLGDARSYVLHDLRNDPVGEVDVAAAHPEVFDELVGILEDLRRELDEIEAQEAGDLGAQADALRALGYLGDD